MRPCAMATAVSETQITSPNRTIPATADATSGAISSPRRTRRVRTGIARASPSKAARRLRAARPITRTSSMRGPQAVEYVFQVIAARRLEQDDVADAPVRAQPLDGPRAVRQYGDSLFGEARRARATRQVIGMIAADEQRRKPARGSRRADAFVHLGRIGTKFGHTSQHRDLA